MRLTNLWMVAVLCLVEAVSAQMVVKNSQSAEVMRITQDGLMGIGTASPAARVAVAGNMVIGSTYAANVPPVDGLLVEGATVIGQSITDPVAKVVVRGSNLDTDTNVRRTVLALTDDFANDQMSHITVAGHSFAPQTVNSTVVSRSGSRGAVTALFGGGSINTVAYGYLGHYTGSSASSNFMGVVAAIPAEDASWTNLARTATRTALYAVNYNEGPDDWGIRAMGPKHYFGGYLSIGTFNLDPAYSLSLGAGARKPGGGEFDGYSDVRLKQINGDYDYGLDEILALQPIRYHYLKNEALGLPGDKEFVGLSAQDVQTVIPEAVSQDGSGYLLLNNNPVIFAMLNAIKELKGLNDRLVTRVQLLEAGQK